MKLHKSEGSIHDYLEAIQRFETAIRLMERGFDFTTPEGCRMVSQLKESLDVLKTEGEVLKELYNGK